MRKTQNKNRLNKFVIIVIILFFILGIMISWWFYNNKKKRAYDLSVTPTSTVQAPTPIAKQTIIPTPTFNPFQVPTPEEIWKKYINSQFKFSMRYPQMVFGVDRCVSNRKIWVPIKIFEDKRDSIIYITHEYYYDNWNSKTKANSESCKKIIYSLELLAKENAYNTHNEYIKKSKPFLGWSILIRNVKNENELDKFIKDNYGSGCLIKSKKIWKQADVYEIEIKSKDWGKETDLGTTACPLNYIYKILYYPKKNILMSVILGQECTFATDYNLQSYKCYDEEMIDSFRFE